MLTEWREGNLGLLQGVLRLTVVADALFTAVAAAVQPVTGLALWFMQGGEWHSRWLWWVLALYVFVGACWLPVVVLQIRLRNAAVAATSISALGPGSIRAFACGSSWVGPHSPVCWCCSD